MRKIVGLLLVCILVTGLLGCKDEKNSELGQRGRKMEEENELHSVVNVKDILHTMNSSKEEMGIQQPMKAMLSAGYKSNEALKVSGILTTDNIDRLVSNRTVVLAEKVYPEALTSEQIYFVCDNKNNEHILIPSGTGVVVEGILKMDETSVYLSDCKFLTPDMQAQTYHANVSEVLENKKNEESVIVGAVKDVFANDLSHDEREEISGGFVDQNDSYFVKALLGASHKMTLTDGTKDIVVYISQNFNENIQVGEKIAVKGVVREEQEIFVWAGDAVYFFDR